MEELINMLANIIEKQYKIELKDKKSGLLTPTGTIIITFTLLSIVTGITKSTK